MCVSDRWSPTVCVCAGCPLTSPRRPALSGRKDCAAAGRIHAAFRAGCFRLQAHNGAAFSRKSKFSKPKKAAVVTVGCLTQCGKGPPGGEVSPSACRRRGFRGRSGGAVGRQQRARSRSAPTAAGHQGPSAAAPGTSGRLTCQQGDIGAFLVPPCVGSLCACLSMIFGGR